MKILNDNLQAQLDQAIEKYNSLPNWFKNEPAPIPAKDSLDIVSGLEKFLRLLNNSTCDKHVDIAENYLTLLDRKWKLSEKHSNPVINALYDKLNSKREELS